jgi:hypothetical protein
MEPLLLILILATGPHHEDLEAHLTEALNINGGAKVHVVTGADALKELDNRGVKDSDLVASPTIGDHLTEADTHLIIIRCERSVAGGDAMIESNVWAHGHDNRHVAISGGANDPDPTNGAISGIMGLTAPWLPDQAPANPDLDARYAHLADTDDWTALLDATTAAADPKSARVWYYTVLALEHLDRKPDAAAAYEKMHAAYPNHILTVTAAGLVAPTRSATVDAMVDDGSNKLSDGTHPPIDGGNTLKDATVAAPATGAAPAPTGGATAPATR